MAKAALVCVILLATSAVVVRADVGRSAKLEGLISLGDAVQSLIDAEPASVGEFRTGRKLQQVVKTSREVRDSSLDKFVLDFIPYTLQSRFLGLGSSDPGALMGYIAGVGLFAFPGMVLAVLSVFSLFFFLALRCCCNCFGGRSRSLGCFFGGVKGECCVCCGNEPGDWKGYTSREMWIFRIMIIVNAVCLLFLPIVGFVGNATFESGVTGVLSTVINTFDDVVGRAQSIESALRVLPYTNSSSSLDLLNGAIDTLKSFRGDIDGYKTLITDYDSIRNYVIIAVMVVPMLIAAFGLLAMLVKAHRVSFCVGLVCFLGSALLWLMFAVHTPIGIVFYDACDEADRFLRGDGGAVEYPSILECQNGTVAPLAPLKEQANIGIDQAFDVICGFSRDACNISSRMYCSATCSRGNAKTFPNERMSDMVTGCVPTVGARCNVSYDGVSPCGPGGSGVVTLCQLRNITFSQCATQCNHTQLRDAAKNILEQLAIADAYADIFDTYVAPLIACTYINGIVDSIKSDICVKMGGGVDGIATACVVVACFLIPFTFLTIMGCKRFRSDNPDPAKVHYDDDMDKHSVISLRIAEEGKTSSGLPADYAQSPAPLQNGVQANDEVELASLNGAAGDYGTIRPPVPLASAASAMSPPPPLVASTSATHNPDMPQQPLVPITAAYHLKSPPPPRALVDVTVPSTPVMPVEGLTRATTFSSIPSESLISEQGHAALESSGQSLLAAAAVPESDDDPPPPPSDGQPDLTRSDSTHVSPDNN